MGHKGHYGQYTGNAKWSTDHARTKVTKENYKASESDDAAHIDYLKRDVLDDQKAGGKYKDENQTADEKHISKLAGDMKYDKEHHGSPAKNIVGMARRAGESALKAVTTSEVQTYNQQIKDIGAPDDFNISKSSYSTLKRGGSPGWPDNRQWDGNQWSSPANMNSPLHDKEDRKVRKTVRKALKARTLDTDAQEIEGFHGYGTNKKSLRKRGKAEKKTAKSLKTYKSLSDEGKEKVEEAYFKATSKKN